jgi:hypothetical protein
MTVILVITMSIINTNICCSNITDFQSEISSVIWNNAMVTEVVFIITIIIAIITLAIIVILTITIRKQSTIIIDTKK